MLGLTSGEMGGAVLYVVANARDLGLMNDSASAQLVTRLSAQMDYPYQATFLGFVAAQDGRFADAQAAVDRLEFRADSLMAAGDSAYARSTRGQWWTMRGRIAAVREQSDSAISYLRRGLAMINGTWSWPRDLDRYWLAHLIEDRGDEQEAMTIYGSLYLNPWMEALGYFHRAELHERRGERESALRYYSRFLDLWKDADEHLQPRVESARLAIERLGGGERGT